MVKKQTGPGSHRREKEQIYNLLEIMILAILQARCSSSRLPNKVLKPILGKPMLLHQIERLRNSEMIDKLIVATSSDATDDDIEKMCLNNNIEVFRGDLDNVLDRFYQCASLYNPKYVVRLTGDCPLADWKIIDKVIQHCLKGGFDYVRTSEKFPDGLDVGIMTASALKIAWKNAKIPSEIEHVTQYIGKNPKQFKNGKYDCDQNLSHHRWTVDEPEDFIMVESVYKALYQKNPLFLTNDILELLREQPDLVEINNSFTRNEGLKKSLKEDKNV